MKTKQDVKIYVECESQQADYVVDFIVGFPSGSVWTYKVPFKSKFLFNRFMYWSNRAKGRTAAKIKKLAIFSEKLGVVKNVNSGS